MAARRWRGYWRCWCCWLWLLCCGSLVLAVVPESDGGSDSMSTGSRWLHVDGNGDHSDREGFLSLPCPQRCRCTNLPRQLECIAAVGEMYPPQPPPDTTSLILDGYALVLAHHLEKLQHLESLKISHSRLENLKFLPPLPNLKILDIRHNHIRSLGEGHLKINTPALTHLDVAYNGLLMLNHSDLEGLHHLSLLDVKHNPLISAEAKALKGLTSLTYLDVSQTRISRLHHQWLDDAVKLKYLNVSGAGLYQIPVLHGNYLREFDASHNLLTHLPNGLVSNAVNLKYLFLHHNPLDYVSVAAFTGASNMHVLDLSHTQVVNINEFVFSKIPLLEKLYLEHNKRLVRIEHGAFTGLHNLQDLNLAYTLSLTEIEEVAFDGLPKLRLLDLRNSSLTVLPLSFNKLVKHNTTVLLAGTELHCDCYHSWLPELLTKADISTWSGIEPLACTDGQFRDTAELTMHIDSLGCEAPEAVTPSGSWVSIQASQSALLECNITAHPPRKVLWLSAKHDVFRYNSSINSEEWTSHHLQEVTDAATSDPRFEVLASGQLLIRNVVRSDVGWYKCFAYNSVGNTSLYQFLSLDDTPLRNLYTESLLFGSACAALFFLITLLVQLVNYLMDRLGCECCCCKDRMSTRAKQVKKLLESVESYKTQQLDRLRENYNCQVASIKESCYQQMDRIRESYSTHGKNMKDLRDYSTQGLTSLRDQYLEQVNRVRDYSNSQMNRVRENYVFQRNRIRKFSAHQLLRLRETYKYQQKTLNKILENLPDLYLQNCRTGGCQRSDSIIFDDGIDGLDAYYKVDFFDTQSHGSDYFTPASTLTRSFRSSRGQDPNKQHSRTSSNTSSDFVEAQSWIRRESSAVGGNSPSRTLPSLFGNHNRSLSVAGPTPYVADPVRVHKRSLSASHPHKVAPAPETRGVPAKITLCEEAADYNSSNPVSTPTSVHSTPTKTNVLKLTSEEDSSNATSRQQNTNTQKDTSPKHQSRSNHKNDSPTKLHQSKNVQNSDLLNVSYQQPSTSNLKKLLSCTSNRKKELTTDDREKSSNSEGNTDSNNSETASSTNPQDEHTGHTKDDIQMKTAVDDSSSNSSAYETSL